MWLGEPSMPPCPVPGCRAMADGGPARMGRGHAWTEADIPGLATGQRCEGEGSNGTRLAPRLGGLIGTSQHG